MTKRRRTALNCCTIAILALAGTAHADMTTTSPRIGCRDVQRQGNRTRLVGQACNRRMDCSYKAPTPQQYQAAGVQAAGRSFCTQAMEIKYDCADGLGQKTAFVPGDAWGHPPAQLHC